MDVAPAMPVQASAHAPAPGADDVVTQQMSTLVQLKNKAAAEAAATIAALKAEVLWFCGAANNDSAVNSSVCSVACSCV